MFNLPDSLFCDYTVRCKGCFDNIPAPVETMPSSWIVVLCPICGTKRRYLPMDIFRGKLSTKTAARIVMRRGSHGS